MLNRVADFSGARKTFLPILHLTNDLFTILFHTSEGDINKKKNQAVLCIELL